MELNNYIINPSTLIIIPIGKRKSIIYELEKEIIVKMSPLSIIKKSCLYYGSSYDGRAEFSKEFLGINSKVPILIEDINKVIFFPINGCIKNNSTWVSYYNLDNFAKWGEFSTMLYFLNNKKYIVDVNYNYIDNQIIRCIKLDVFFEKRKKFIEKNFHGSEEFKY